MVGVVSNRVQSRGAVALLRHGTKGKFKVRDFQLHNEELGSVGYFQPDKPVPEADNQYAHVAVHTGWIMVLPDLESIMGRS